MTIQSVFPSLAKRGQGRFFKEIIHKIPLNPPFSRQETFERRIFHPLYKTEYSSSFFINKKAEGI
jgi:hypothetical protein